MTSVLTGRKIRQMDRVGGVTCGWTTEHFHQGLCQSWYACRINFIVRRCAVLESLFFCLICCGHWSEQTIKRMSGWKRDQGENNVCLQRPRITRKTWWSLVISTFLYLKLTEGFKVKKVVRFLVVIPKNSHNIFFTYSAEKIGWNSLNMLNLMNGFCWVLDI